MMKRYALLLLSIIVCGLAGAKGHYTIPQANHYFFLNGVGGYSTMIPQNKDFKFKGGAGANFGLGYEFQTNHFWINASVEAQYFNITSNYNMPNMSTRAFDSQGTSIIYNYSDVTTRDNLNILYANIPIMFGYHTNGFYIGIGGKVGFPILATDKLQANYTTTATYVRYIEDFANMPNHYYGQYTASASDKIKCVPRFAANLELSYDVNIKKANDDAKRNVLRIGLYAEYGFNNIFQSYTNEMCKVNPLNLSELAFTPLYKTSAQNNKNLNPLLVGVRISWLLHLGGKDHCNCSDIK